jgi:hypothetical protein
VDAAHAITLLEGKNHSLLVLRSNITVMVFMNEINNEWKGG